MTTLADTIKAKIEAAPDKRAYAAALADAHAETGDWPEAIAVADKLTGPDYESTEESQHYAKEDWREEKADRAEGGKRWRNVHNPKLVTYKDPTRGGEAAAGEDPAAPAADKKTPSPGEDRNSLAQQMAPKPGAKPQRCAAIRSLASQGRGWMLEIAKGMGIDEDKVPSIDELEQRLVIQDVQDDNPFGLDPEILNYPPEGMGTPVPVPRQQAEHYSRPVSSRSPENAATLAALLKGHALGDALFVPSAGNDRFIRAKVVTLAGGDSDLVPAPEAAQRLVIVDDREKASNDLYFHFGAGQFDIKEATPISPSEGPEKLADLIRQDPPAQEFSEADPMGEEAGRQYGRDQYLDGLASAFLARPPEQFARKVEPAIETPTEPDPFDALPDVLARLTEVISRPQAAPVVNVPAQDSKLDGLVEAVARLAAIVDRPQAAPVQDNSALVAVLGRLADVVSRPVPAPIVQAPDNSALLAVVAQLAARPPRKVVEKTEFVQNENGKTTGATREITEVDAE